MRAFEALVGLAVRPRGSQANGRSLTVARSGDACVVAACWDSRATLEDRRGDAASRRSIWANGLPAPYVSQTLAARGRLANRWSARPWPP